MKFKLLNGKVVGEVPVVTGITYGAVFVPATTVESSTGPPELSAKVKLTVTLPSVPLTLAPVMVALRERWLISADAGIPVAGLVGAGP